MGEIRIGTGVAVAIGVVVVLFVSLGIFSIFRKAHPSPAIVRHAFHRSSNTRLPTTADHAEGTVVAKDTYRCHVAHFSPSNFDIIPHSWGSLPPNAYIPRGGSPSVHAPSPPWIIDGQRIIANDSTTVSRRNTRDLLQLPNASFDEVEVFPQLPVTGSFIKPHEGKGIVAPSLKSHLSLHLNRTSCTSPRSPSLTSLSRERDLSLNGGLGFANTQLPSPPPSAARQTFLTKPLSPSQPQLELDISDEDIKSWSDILSLADYEREEHFIRAPRSFGRQSYLPSPPPTPKLLFTPPSPPPATFVADVRLEEVHESCVSHDDLPPYQRLGYDLQSRLTLKRSTSQLSEPAELAKPTTRVLLKQVASVLKPRPSLVDFQPLVLRSVNHDQPMPRHGRALFPGSMASPFGAAAGSKRPTPTSRETEILGTSEVSPHVSVLELLIEQVSERRTADMPLGVCD